MLSETQAFFRFLADHYDLPDNVKADIIEKVIVMINSEKDPNVIVKYLETVLEFPNFEFVQVLMEELLELQNNLRMWILKGHTPNELFKQEKKFLKPLPSAPFKANQATSEVMNINDHSKPKIGRNDPCPCGSGKKYKRCCMK